MPTFDELNKSVSKRLQDPNNTSVSYADVGEAINDAIKYWKFTRFWFNAVADSVSLTLQVANMPLPSNFLVEIKDNPFRIQYSNMSYYLRKVDPYEYDNWALDNGYGIPQIYTNRAGVYQCYPIPDQGYTLARYYLKDYAPLVAPTDNNDFTNNADQLIIYWALSKLYAERRQDEKMETYYTGRTQDELENLSLFTAKREAPDDIAVHSFLI